MCTFKAAKSLHGSILAMFKPFSVNKYHNSQQNISHLNKTTTITTHTDENYYFIAHSLSITQESPSMSQQTRVVVVQQLIDSKLTNLMTFSLFAEK